MIIRTTLIWSFILYLSSAVSAQEAPTRLDTLLMELDTISVDTQKVRHLNEIASLIRGTDLQKAADYVEQSLALATKINFVDGKIRALNTQSVIYRRQGNTDEALAAAKESLRISEELQDYFYIGANNNALGNIYQVTGANDTAIIHFLSAFEAYEKDKYLYGQAMVNNNVGIIFKNQEQYEIAADYYQKAIALYLQILGTEEEGNAPTGLANAYMNLGNVSANDSIALVYHQMALDQFTAIGNQYGLASANISTGSTYISLKEYEKALPYYQEGLRIGQKVGSKGRVMAAQMAIAKIYNQLGRYTEALPYAQNSLALAKATKDLAEEYDAEAIIARIYKNLGNYQEAMLHSENNRALGDSLFKVEKIQLSNDLEAKYQSSKTQAELAASQLQTEKEQNLRNRVILLATVLLLLGLLVAQWLITKQRKKQQQTQLALALQEKETEQLKEIDQLKTSFFTNLSHELRTPLTLILSPLADILEDKKAAPIHKRLKIVQSNARNLHNLVNEIMDLSKVEAGKLELQETTIPIASTATRIFSSFESMAEIRRIDFVLNNQLPEDIDVQLDHDKFEKIINNLLANAIKFTNEDGQVNMNAYKSENLYHFEISDTGSGIHADDLPYIFDRFYQAKKGQEIQQGGTGVGLALSKELAQLLGGELSVKSTLGTGSTFLLRLPLKELAASSKPTIAQTDTETDDTNAITWTPITIQGSKPKLLITEDNPEMGQYLLQILSDHYQCTLATDGLEAIRQLRTQNFDCITSDVMMPNMDGFELRDRINQTPEWKKVPFLLLTARHLEEDKLRGFQLGIDDYVTKPFSTRELKARIHNLIQNKIERDAFGVEEAQLPQEQQLTADEEWLQMVEKKVLENLDNPQFGVEDLGKEVGYSSKQLGRLIKKQTGLSTVNFVLEIRLQKARDLMERRVVPTVTAAQLDVGISSMSYFTRKFTERFGKNPKAVLAGVA